MIFLYTLLASLLFLCVYRSLRYKFSVFTLYVGISSFYYIPLILISSNFRNLPIFQPLLRDQYFINYFQYFDTVQITILMLGIFSCLGYLLPIKSVDFGVLISKASLRFSLNTLLYLLFSVYSYLYFTSARTNIFNPVFSGYYQFLLLLPEFISLCLSLYLFFLRKIPFYFLFMYALLLISFVFLHKRLELISSIYVLFSSFCLTFSRQYKNLVPLSFLLLVFILFIVVFVSNIRSSVSFSFAQLLYAPLLEPFLASQSFLGYLSLYQVPRFSFVNTYASLLSLVPTPLFPNKWDHLFSLGYLNNREINLDGANIIITGLYDDFGIYGVCIFSFVLCCMLRLIDNSKFYFANHVLTSKLHINFYALLYFSLPFAFFHFRDGLAITVKYLLQFTFFPIFLFLFFGRFKLFKTFSS